MRRWIGLAVAGGILCLAPLLLRTGEGARADDGGEELAKAKSSGYSKNVTPPPLTGVDLAKISLGDEGATAPAHENRVAHLTIDPELQRYAEKALRAGGLSEASIVLTETRTGRVLVYASYVEKGPPRDLAVEAQAPAASVFKIVTGSALVDHAQLTPETKQCYWGGEHKLDAANLVDDPRRDKWCATLAEAMGRSLNTVIARLSSKHLDQAKLLKTATALGFGEPMAFDVPVQPNTINLPDDPLGFARTSAGFWNTTLSPIGGAQLAMTIANHGVVVKPFVVERVVDRGEPRADGKPDKKPPKETLLYRAPQRQVLGRAIRSETADSVMRMMEATVSDGTGFKAFHDSAARPYLPNIAVAGKTGTLTRQSTDQFYTWFVGFAPSRAAEVAVSVLVINHATWRVKANLVARQVLQAYFAKKGAPGVQPPR
jgi:penicillin-binding protein A